MQLHLFEATNGGAEAIPLSTGKFAVGLPAEEWHWRSQISEFSGSILRELGWSHQHVWVIDLTTGEGAIFRHGGFARADLDRHKIWVGPLFEPFLAWLYTQDVHNLGALPSLVHLPRTPFSFYGYRHPGPTVDEDSTSEET